MKLGQAHENATDPLGVLRANLDELLLETDGRMGILMDGSGAVILEAGRSPDLDRTAFASLTVSHLAATRALASLVGEDDLKGLCQQGEHTSLFVAPVADQLILSILFNGRRPSGQVSKEGSRIVSSLEAPLRELIDAGSEGGQPLDPDWVSAAGDEIDRLFEEGA